jgi:hypothetical protein
MIGQDAASLLEEAKTAAYFQCAFATRRLPVIPAKAGIQ